MTAQITRRNLVKGTAAATAAVAAASMMATAAVAEEAAVDDTAAADNTHTMEQTRGAYPWGDTAPQIVEADIEETVECEVAVVGVGLAGAAAVLGAAEAGAATIAYFDKTEAGYSATGNQTAVINGVQENWGRSGIYDIDEICNHEINEGCGWPKHGIWYKWANGIGDTFNWALDTLGDDVHIAADSNEDTSGYDNYVSPLAYPLPDGFDPESEYNTTYATSVAWTSQNFPPAALAKAAESAEVTGYAGHRVEQLIMQDGACVGCYAYNYETGKYKKVNASKGVILSCGDYAGNSEIVKYLCPAVYENGIQLMYSTMDPEGNVANTGEHIKMATWIGARIQQYQAPMIHHMGHSMTGAIFGGMGIAPFFRINKLGKRFMNEDTPGQQTENQIELQKGYGCYMIFDSKWGEEVDNFAPTHGSVYHFLAEGETGDGKSQADVDAGVESGDILKADTLEELFNMLNDQFGLDVDAALASVERYNELAKAGHDDDFGKAANRMFALENPPYYATTMGRATMLVIASGLESDEDCHTYNAERDIIPGLYVAGNAQGDRFAVQYPIAMEGVATSMAIYYGRVAGENCVKGA